MLEHTVSVKLKSSTFISSGSKSEGIDLKGSDYDRMICFNFIRVHESLTDIQSAPHEIILLMETNATKPGFTKLKLVHKSDLHLINDFCKTVGEDIFISSNLVRERNCRNEWIIHGPCLSNPDGDYDLAMCFRCKEWITPAQQWIYRSRTAWPHYTLVTSADIVENTSFATSISSGSKAKGLDLKVSDYDQMMFYNCIRVYENLKDIKYISNKILLVMETSDIKPGFTKIKLVNKSDLDIDMIYDRCETVGEEMYISSKRFRDQDFIDDFINHGPCQSTPGGEYDSAKCFKCNEWITPAQQWIHRSRTAWPDYTLITSALGDYRGQGNALHDLELTIRERYFILDNIETLKEAQTNLDIVKALL
ncbi:unnamed protein product [Mytilus coruscus]|uniref:Uncharacterized protein n=1 Tax=Mytilus coruscus TaxID=42192 RepID=A0A6J8DFJ7_MYTCO|nr:unnamed protein product [Mytilus coruscus]